MAMSLDAHGIRRKTDKASTGHNYLVHYEYFLGLPRDAEFTFLEIGVFRGASALMWSDWFENAQIVGLDLKVPKLKVNPPNLRLFTGDITSPKTLAVLKKKIQAPLVILDDASHKWDDQILGLQTLWPWLRSGGRYIVEDIHTSYMSGFSGIQVFSCANFLSGIASRLQMTEEAKLASSPSSPPWVVRLIGEISAITFLQGSAIIFKK
jgi:hypothetical protein